MTEKMPTRIEDFHVIIDESLLQHFATAATDGSRLSVANGFEEKTWKHNAFDAFVWDNIAETALSALERENLASRPMSAIKKAAKNLRITDGDEKGGEIGEIVLYGILKKYYNALPITPKIYYKQNANDYAKGADSVHIVIHDDGEFSLWLGEAKFYNELNADRLDRIVKSVKDLLSTKKLRKEFNITTSLQDLDKVAPNSIIAAKIREKIGDGIEIDEIKDILNVPIFILHECDETKTAERINDEYKTKIAEYHAKITRDYLARQKKACGALDLYHKIKFHIILFPVPDKDAIVSRFIAEATHLRGEKNGTV